MPTRSRPVLAWLIPFDYPEHTSRQRGAYLALMSATATAFAVAD